MVGAQKKKWLTTLCVAGALVVAGCGDSDSTSSDTLTADTAQTTEDPSSAGEPSASDTPASIAAFCQAALDNQGGADIAADDDPAAIAEKLSANASALEEMAGSAPADVKADTDVVASAARDMADAIAGDPSLEKFNALIEEFANSDANTASENVQTWVKDNCEAGQQ